MEVKLSCKLQESNDLELTQKEEKEQMLYLQEQMDKLIIKLATLKSSTRLNMQQLRGEHYEALDASKHNGTKGTIEELDKLRQNIEDKT